MKCKRPDSSGLFYMPTQGLSGNGNRTQQKFIKVGNVTAQTLDNSSATGMGATKPGTATDRVQLQPQNNIDTLFTPQSFLSVKKRLAHTYLQRDPIILPKVVMSLRQSRLYPTFHTAQPSIDSPHVLNFSSIEGAQAAQQPPQRLSENNNTTKSATNNDNSNNRSHKIGQPYSRQEELQKYAGQLQQWQNSHRVEGGLIHSYAVNFRSLSPRQRSSKAKRFEEVRPQALLTTIMPKQQQVQQNRDTTLSKSFTLERKSDTGSRTQQNFNNRGQRQQNGNILLQQKQLLTPVRQSTAKEVGIASVLAHRQTRSDMHQAHVSQTSFLNHTINKMYRNRKRLPDTRIKFFRAREDALERELSRAAVRCVADSFDSSYNNNGQRGRSQSNDQKLNQSHNSGEVSVENSIVLQPYFEQFHIPPHRRSTKTLARLAKSYVQHREIKKIVGKILEVDGEEDGLYRARADAASFPKQQPA